MSGYPPDASEPPAGGVPPGGLPPSEPPSMVPPPTPTVPWEDPAVGGLAGFGKTVVLFLKNPVAAYSRMPLNAQVAKPVVYAVIVGWVGALFAQGYRLALGNPLLGMLPPDMVTPALRQQMAPPPLAVAVGLVLAPLFILIVMMVWSGILHLMLLMLGGAGSGFAATLRVVCYAATANVFQILPICGGPVAALWTLVLEVVGLAAAHKTSTVKAALAVLIPLLLCCICVASAVVLFGAAIAALASGWR